MSRELPKYRKDDSLNSEKEIEGFLKGIGSLGGYRPVSGPLTAKNFVVASSWVPPSETEPEPKGDDIGMYLDLGVPDDKQEDKLSNRESLPRTMADSQAMKKEVKY